ncbi:FecR family protein [Cecembia calidifontis]|jgi:ferric-dicitrate binding protein FerR (iron transport regulator)|uniref:FecR family protein n=1 Tax=Cecembia calidifontis TaxID=1187080 RepID=A0A4Q7PB35_9BACT|nr:FecR family protein [Cecembia calidifontis]RZS97506.1 FecR family protein [Cecembia calidifontis]
MKFTKQDYLDYIQGKLDSKKAASFSHWMESKEGERIFHQWVEEEWEEEVKNSEDPKQEDKAAIINPGSNGKNTIEWRLWAAIISIFIVASLLLYNGKEGHLPEEYKTEIKNTEVQKSAPKGKKTKIKLPDGSLVYLNSESSITYLTDFSDKRTIHLKGEAFFEVQSDPSKPFTVVTGPISTQALGTSFNINAYEEDLEIIVALASGKIKVSHELNGQEVFVDPGEAVDYNMGDSHITKDQVDIQKILNWKNGILHFEKIPFPQVIKTLERWYGVDFEVKNQKDLPLYKCSGTFQPNEYLSNVLAVLAHSVDFNYTIQGKKVILEFK